MKKRTWLYLYNPFLSEKISDIVLYQIADYLLNILENEQADPEIKEWLTKLQPFLLKFKESFHLYHAVKGISIGETQRFNDLMDMIPDKLHEWIHDIEGVIKYDSVEFKGLFSKGKSVFYEGSIDSRLNKIKELGINLALYPALLEVAEKVNLFYNDLTLSKTKKVNKFDDINQGSYKTKTYHKDLAEILYYILGRAIAKFYKTPDEIERFFKSNLIRSKSVNNNKTNAYLLEISANSSAVADFILKAGKTYLIRNTGSTSLFFGGITSINDVPDQATLSELIAGSEIQITSQSLGFPQKNLIYFLNKDTSEDGEVEITEL